MLEVIVLNAMRSVLHLYRRFLDDVFAYLERSAVAEFTRRMNALHPKLRFDFVTHPTEAAFLDLHIHKGSRFETSSIFDLSVHQKKMNLYLYIPFNSFHTDAMKRSFIQTELMRYIRNSSDLKEYGKLKEIFYQRLRDRGYPHSFLQPLFHSIFYADRHFFLWPSATLHEHPLIHSAPPVSACLQKRIARWKQLQPSAPSESSIQPPVFIIPYTPLSRLLPTRSLLLKYWDLVQLALGPTLSPLPIMAYQSSPSLLTTLVYQRARRLERQREDKQSTSSAVQQRSSTQSDIMRFFGSAPANSQSPHVAHLPESFPARSHRTGSSALPGQ
jgi:hypothetical protein